MAFRHLAPWLADPHNLFFVTLKKPFDMIAVARSLQNSPYKNGAILMTKLDWWSSYLPIYA
jgi:hypothetical protein